MIPVIQTQNLEISFGKKQVLHKIDLEIQEGSFTLVIGPNGAGKTTLLKAILGMVRPDSGQVKLKNRPMASIGPRERAKIIGYVPQSLDLSFNMDVRSFIELSRFAHEDFAKERRDIVDDSMAITQTEPLQNALFNELSGGERQRVLIAAALAQKPQVLVLDEPESSLDPGHRIELVELLGRLLKEQALTILLVTHDWNEYATLMPDIVALKEGVVAFKCPAEGLRDKLSGLYACAFHHFQINGIWLSLPNHLDNS